MNETEIERMRKSFEDEYGISPEQALGILQNTFRSLQDYLIQCMAGVAKFIDSVFPQPTRADIRAWKHEHRRARHDFMTHGKHGLRRPRGRRKVSG